MLREVLGALRKILLLSDIFMNMDHKNGQHFQRKQDYNDLPRAVGTDGLNTWWSKIVELLPGRTGTQIQNKWYSHIQRRLLQIGIHPYSPPVQRSPRTSRTPQAPRVPRDPTLPAMVSLSTTLPTTAPLPIIPLATDPFSTIPPATASLSIIPPATAPLPTIFNPPADITQTPTPSVSHVGSNSDIVYAFLNVLGTIQAFARDLENKLFPSQSNHQLQMASLENPPSNPIIHNTDELDILLNFEIPDGTSDINDCM